MTWAIGHHKALLHDWATRSHGEKNYKYIIIYIIIIRKLALSLYFGYQKNIIFVMTPNALE